MKIYIITILFIISSLKILAQKEKKEVFFNDISLDFAGTTFGVSISYERLIRLSKNETIFFVPSVGYAQALWYPTGIVQGNFLIGKKLFFETGLASIYYEQTFHLGYRIGIRYHNVYKKGFLFRIAFTQTFLGDIWTKIPGFGIGYVF